VETVTAIALGGHGLGAALDDFDAVVEADGDFDADLAGECEVELEEWLVEVALGEG
jgi:hypothetical protein